MQCAWQELLHILPPSLRQEVDRLGEDTLQELRLRLGLVPQLVGSSRTVWLEKPVSQQDLSYVVNTASQYSPWAASTVAQGYLTAAGGHRIGLCGQAVVQQGQVTGLRQVRSLCIRVAREIRGIAAGLPETGNLLIIGPPGAGKTTLLRDLIRMRSDRGPGAVAVVDERGELFPEGLFSRGKRTDVLTGCGKREGVEMLLRTMGPQTIAVDEITAEADCQALHRAGWCGVNLLATAHASSRRDLETRPVYRTILEHGLFDLLVILQRDKTWRMERMLREC